MFEGIKKALYYQKAKLLLKQGLENGQIVPFDEEFYKQMNNVYFAGIPVSMHIKYLKPLFGPMNCYERSYYMFVCFDNAVLVRASNKDLELAYGKENSGHGWIEIGDYVYDPTTLMRFNKELYYKIYIPNEIKKYTKKEFKEDKIYQDSKQTLEDIMPGGSKRVDLITTIPLTRGIAEMSQNKEFIEVLNRHLELIKYNENEIFDELMNTDNGRKLERKL